MGNNVVKVKNLSGKKVICLSFNNSDVIYWSYREMIRPPVDGKEAELDGLQGGGAVKVAVVWDVDPTTNRFIYDLFWVRHGETLTIRQKGVGMDGPLVDVEGYPRADIDVYSVRHARHKIACLQTDHTMVMTEIEEELYRIHAEIRENKSAGGTPMEVTPVPSASKQEVAFVKVDKVDSGSPASAAGIEVGDEVVEFGSVTADNFTNLQQIGQVVQHSIGHPVRLKVLRDNKPRTLSITPGPWSGRGNLGCNIVAIKR